MAQNGRDSTSMESPPSKHVIKAIISPIHFNSTETEIDCELPQDKDGEGGKLQAQSASKWRRPCWEHCPREPSSSGVRRQK